MNKIPLHKASQYSESGMVLHHFSSYDISHVPVGYAHQDDYYIFGVLTHGTACGIIDFKEMHLKFGDVFFVLPGQVHRFASSEDAEGWLLMTDCKFVGDSALTIMHISHASFHGQPEPLLRSFGRETSVSPSLASFCPFPYWAEVRNFAVKKGRQI